VHIDPNHSVAGVADAGAGSATPPTEEADSRLGLPKWATSIRERRKSPRRCHPKLYSAKDLA